jgi:transposase
MFNNLRGFKPADRSTVFFTKLHSLAIQGSLIVHQSRKFSAQGFLLTLFKAILSGKASFNEMSKRKRRHLSAEFKARIAREAMENQKTIQEIAKDNDIAPTQVSAWKKELESRVSEIFERKNATNEASVNFEKKSARLERRIGQLLIEKEFLEEKCNELGIDTSEKR